MEKSIAFGPASVANVGPFYDTMGYCLSFLGDFAIAEKTKLHRQANLINIIGPYATALTTEVSDTKDNCAQILANEIWDHIGKNCDFGIDLTLFKGMPTASGLGSSAATCVAATKAITEIVCSSCDFTDQDITRYLVNCERASANDYYLDNVVPSYWGGFFIIGNEWIEKIDVKNYYTIVFLDNSKMKTSGQREAVNNHFYDIIEGESVPNYKIGKILNYIKFQSSFSARFINALLKNDLATAGNCISESENNFLEKSRTKTMKHYQETKKMILQSGALGCSLSGSGPAIFAITDSEENAFSIRDKVLKCAISDFKTAISPLNNHGAILIDDLESYKQNCIKYHNFWD